MHSEANVTDFDLHDSYLAQYEMAFKANASGVMCSESAAIDLSVCPSDKAYTSHDTMRL